MDERMGPAGRPARLHACILVRNVFLHAMRATRVRSCVTDCVRDCVRVSVCAGLPACPPTRLPPNSRVSAYGRIQNGI